MMFEVSERRSGIEDTALLVVGMEGGVRVVIDSLGIYGIQGSQIEFHLKVHLDVFASSNPLSRLNLEVPHASPDVFSFPIQPESRISFHNLSRTQTAVSVLHCLLPKLLHKDEPK